jgi:formate dehydrogenase-N gamma subunit
LTLPSHGVVDVPYKKGQSVDWSDMSASLLAGSTENQRPEVEHPESSTMVRFTLTVRLLHWWMVATFATALLTGLAMGSEMENTNLFHLHVAAVIAMGVGFVVALIFGNTMSVLRFVRDALIPERSDFEFVTQTVSRPFHRTGVKWGKFNLGQKGLAWMMLGSLTAIIITGINSWHAGGDASGPHMTAVIVALILLSVHVFMAVVNPMTRPALPGMIFGRVKRSWALHHHMKWVQDEDRRNARTPERDQI